MKKVMRCMLVAITLFSGSAWGLTDGQQKELREHGIITIYDDHGNKMGHYEVNFMPGWVNVTADAKENWLRAYDLMDDLVDGKVFWRNKFIASFNDGITVMKDGVRDGVIKIPEGFRETIEKNQKVDGSFGDTARKLLNWGSFSLVSAMRLLYTVGGFGVGGIYAIAAPTSHVLYRTVGATTKAVVAGTLWPIVKYSWNGVAWVIVRNRNEPKKGDMTVTFVPEMIENT